MSWGAALGASLSSTLDRPRWWVLALAGFLLRGGLLLFLAPIIILPTPAGLTNALAPALVGFVFGSPSDPFIAVVVVAVATVTAWIIVGGLLAAWIEVALVAEVAASPRLGVHLRDGLRLSGRALGIRLISQTPLAMALGWGALRLVDAVYAELITPGDVTTPIVLRVALRIPDVIAAIVVAWLAGETAGGLGVRQLVMNPRRSGWRALGLGWLELVARPSAAVTLLVTSAAVLLVAGSSAVGAGFAWQQVRVALADDAHPILVAITLASFVAIWLASFGLVAVAVAWRSAAWTFEAVRRGRSAVPLRHAAAGEPV